jgi:hypothetical protein
MKYIVEVQEYEKSKEIPVAKNVVHQLQPAKWVLESVCCTVFGFTKAQLYHYRTSGLMAEGVHFTKNPANRYVYCIPAIERWMEGKL